MSSSSTSAVATATALNGLTVREAASSTAATAEANPPPCHLPFEVVVVVLQHVPQQHRLQVAALVCQTWAAAAAAATSSIHLSLSNFQPAFRHARTSHLSQWLTQHAWQVRRMQMEGNYMSRPRLVLPTYAMQSLEHLTITDCRVCFTSTAKQDLAPAGPSSSATALSSSLSAQFAPNSSKMPLLRQQQERKPTAQPALHTPRLPAQQHDPSNSTSCPTAALTSLRLQGCVLEWGPGMLPSAVSFQNLQCLDLQQLLPGELSREQQQGLRQLVPAAFQQMSQLTQLVLKSLNHYEAVMLAGLAAGLGNMQGLLELQVDMMQLTAPPLAGLPPSITLLELAGAKQLVLSRDALPSLAKLTSLRELYVEGVRRFEPRLLCCMPKLQTFRLRSSSSSRFLPDGTSGTQDLLAALRGLTGLQSLGLRNVLQHLLPEEQGEVYAGLTASSVLQQLDLSACRFPPNSGQVLLRGIRSLPHLRQLVLYRCEDPPGSVLQIQDLEDLVSCCPALQDLALWLPTRSSSAGSNVTAGVAASGGAGSAEGIAGSSSWVGGSKPLHTQPLLALSGLTQLVLAGPGVTCAELAAVGQLQGLSSLALYRCSPLTDISLLQLTQLTQLTVLAIDAHSCVTKWLGVSEYLFLQGQAGRPGQAQAPMGPADRTQGIARAIMAVRRQLPVWQQLRRLLLTGNLLDEPSG